MKIMIMKVEKDNAMDRSDVCEQAAKDAKVNITKYINTQIHKYTNSQAKVNISFC